jgi:outer membrane lipoprotein carrier protein
MIHRAVVRRATCAAGVALAALLLTPGVHAQANGVEQLRTFLAKTQSARGEFTQRVSGPHAKSGAAPAQSSGRFVFQRPGKFRWVYEKPYEQLLVADGDKLFLFDKDLNQVTVKKLAAALPASPASILFGTNAFERDFDVKNDGMRDGVAWVIATPRAKDSPFELIAIGFRDGLPAAMRLVDSFGQTSLLAFAKVERNPAVDEGAFRFVTPKGADVLEDK